MKEYLFLLGRNPILSRAELKNFCREIWYNEEKSLFIGKNLRFENPRDLPKTHEQLFLDRLGGVIRFGEIMGEFESLKDIQQKIIEEINNDNKIEERILLGFSAFGCGRNFLKSFSSKIKDLLQIKSSCKVRIENSPSENLTSGRIFNAKLLKKGNEFIIVKNNSTYLLSKTLANQNIRNYTLRDRIKTFRDMKRGMLPPKLAQILINLANPNYNETIIDPFCGTGTINIEAAIMGYQTIGSDIDEKIIIDAKNNFDQMAEKFRYNKEIAKFLVSDAKNFPKDKQSGVISTEGYLGFNFANKPTIKGIEKNASDVFELWLKIFQKLSQSNIRTVSFCLPVWDYYGKQISIAQKLFAKIKKNAYTPLALFNGQQTYLYARPGAFVTREICVVTKKR